MAVLNKIRQRSVFLIVIIALALFSFVLSDLFRNGGAISQKSQNIIATINGNDIDRTDFARKVEAASRGFGGRGSNIQAVNYVWDQELRTAVFGSEIDKLGVQVGAKEVNQLLAEALANNPTFQNEAGLFDKAKMQEYVANIKATSPQAYRQWLDYEESVVGKGARETAYMNMIKGGVGATLKEGELKYKMENDAVDIKYVQLPYSSIEDKDIKVTDAEILVYNGNVDDIIGYVRSFDLFKKPKSLQSILKPVVFVPETMYAKDVLNLLTKKNKSMAVVIDEYGGTSGIITVEDIVEELFGEIEDEHDSIILIEEKLGDNYYRFSARMEVDYVNETYKLNLPESENYETLGGMIVNHTEEIPEEGDVVKLSGCQLYIIETSNTKVEIVELKVKTEE